MPASLEKQVRNRVAAVRAAGLDVVSIIFERGGTITIMVVDKNARDPQHGGKKWA